MHLIESILLQISSNFSPAYLSADSWYVPELVLPPDWAQQNILAKCNFPLVLPADM